MVKKKSFNCKQVTFGRVPWRRFCAVRRVRSSSSANAATRAIWTRPRRRNWPSLTASSRPRRHYRKVATTSTWSTVSVRVSSTRASRTTANRNAVICRNRKAASPPPAICLTMPNKSWPWPPHLSYHQSPSIPSNRNQRTSPIKTKTIPRPTPAPIMMKPSTICPGCVSILFLIEFNHDVMLILWCSD